MFQGFFEIKTAQDLLDKLKREYTRLQKSPLDQQISKLVSGLDMIDIT